MPKLIISRPCEALECIPCDDLLAEIKTQWPHGFPAHAELVMDGKAIAREQAAEALRHAEEATVVLHFGGLETATVISIVAAVVSVGVAAYAYLTAPDIPKASLANNQDDSPNASLSERTNKPRVGGLRPIIYGEVNAVPDLIALPYRFFKNNAQYDVSLLDVGMGKFELSQHKESETLITDIDNNLAVRILPNQLVNTLYSQAFEGDCDVNPYADPQMQVNPDTLEEEPTNPNYSDLLGRAYDVREESLVTQQPLRSPNAENIVTTTAELEFTDEGLVTFNDPSIMPMMVFAAGDQVLMKGCKVKYVAQGTRTSDTKIINYDGVWTIDSVSTNTLQLIIDDSWPVIPQQFNGNDYEKQNKNYHPQFYNQAFDNTVGGFVTRTLPNLILCNVVAPNGLYKAAENQEPIDVDVELQVDFKAVDDSVVASEAYTITLSGSSFQRRLIGESFVVDVGELIWEYYNSLIVPTSDIAYITTSLSRATESDYTFNGTVVDEVILDSIYYLDHYGNDLLGQPADKWINETGDTLVHVIAKQDEGANTGRKRKHNVQAKRIIKLYDDSGTETSEGFSDAVDDVLIAACLDEQIGGFAAQNVNIPQIRSAKTAIEAHFSATDAAYFGGTFSKRETSFEDIATTISSACFSRAFRVPEVILEPELPQSIAKLLINSRVKLPSSESVEYLLGAKDNDGVEVKYFAKTTGEQLTVSVPNEGLNKAKTVEMAGVQSEEKALAHAWRIWNKIKYQHSAIDVQCTAEADLLRVGDLALITSSRSTGAQQGEVESQNGLTVTLDRTVELTGNDVLFLQLPDATVQAIEIVSGEGNTVELAEMPSLPLALDSGLYARATWQIVAESEQDADLWFITEKKGGNTVSLAAMNYTNSYYTND